MARPTGTAKNFCSEFSKNLTKVLKEKNITAYQLSKEIGYSQGCISRLKKGYRDPSIGFVVAVSNYFNISTDWFLKNKTE